VQTLSPSAVTSITSTASLSAYKKLMVTISLNPGGSDRPVMRFNGDTGTNYASVAFNGTASTSTTTEIEFRASSLSTLLNNTAIIYDANISAPKTVEVWSQNAIGKASWLTATPITSITIAAQNGVTTHTGTIKIYGKV
jgi:hypothetical protein